jgi:hypothetical protein
MDVKSLYTVIPHDDGLKALQHFLDKRENLNPPTRTIIRLAELILTLNSFAFDGNYYRQKHGIAMGTKMGPSFAKLFMGFLEERINHEYKGPKPQLHLRYIDDVFGITQLNEEELTD